MKIDNQDNVMTIKVHDNAMIRILGNIPSSLVLLSLIKFNNNNISSSSHSPLDANDNDMFDYAQACYNIIKGLKDSIKLFTFTFIIRIVVMIDDNGKAKRESNGVIRLLRGEGFDIYLHVAIDE